MFIYSAEKLANGYALALSYGLTPEEIVRVYRKFPRLMGLNLQSHLQLEKLKFIRKILNVVIGPPLHIG